METIKQDDTRPVEFEGEQVVEEERARATGADRDSLEEIEIMHCPVCQAIDPFDIDTYEYECQGCGTQFRLLRGPQDRD